MLIFKKKRCYMSFSLDFPDVPSRFESEPTCSIVVICIQDFQIGLMVEIYSKSLVRAIGKVLLMKFS